MSVEIITKPGDAVPAGQRTRGQSRVFISA
jgi:hypothetical protein